MKKNKYEDFGTPVKIIDDKDALNILKVVSTNTWICEIPETLVDLIKQKYYTLLASLKYVPNIYFKLDKNYKKDKRIIKATIKSFRNLGHIDEINTRAKPIITKKNQDKI